MQGVQDNLLILWLGAERYVAFTRLSENSNVENLVVLNSKVATSLLADVGHVEVALRNLMNSGLQARLVAKGFEEHWLQDPSGELLCLGGEQLLKTVRTARSKVTNRKGESNPSDVLAELTLGFWSLLLGKRFAAVNKDLIGMFVGAKNRNVRLISSELQSIRKFRNRLAHHHRIIHRDLESDWKGILSFAHTLHPELKKFIEKNSTFPAVLSELLVLIPSAKVASEVQARD